MQRFRLDGSVFGLNMPFDEIAIQSKILASNSDIILSLTSFGAFLTFVD